MCLRVVGILVLDASSILSLLLLFVALFNAFLKMLLIICLDLYNVLTLRQECPQCISYSVI